MNHHEIYRLIAVLVPIIVITLLILGYLSARRSVRVRQQMGIEWLLTLKKLLVGIQQHRGISFSVQNGNLSMKGRLPALQSEISQHIRLLGVLEAEHEAHDHWLAFNDHWGRLRGSCLQLNADNSLNQHNQLITTLLYLFDDIADACQLCDTEFSMATALSTFWRNVLQTAEWTGQARALGSGVLSSRKCGSVERIRLRFICSQIQSYLNSQPGRQGQSQTLIELMNTIENEILENSQLDYSPEAYFELATRAIGEVVHHFDAGMASLSREIGKSNSLKVIQPHPYDKKLQAADLADNLIPANSAF